MCASSLASHSCSRAHLSGSDRPNLEVWCCWYISQPTDQKHAHYNSSSCSCSYAGASFCSCSYPGLTERCCVRSLSGEGTVSLVNRCELIRLDYHFRCVAGLSVPSLSSSLEIPYLLVCSIELTCELRTTMIALMTDSGFVFCRIPNSCLFVCTTCNGGPCTTQQRCVRTGIALSVDGCRSTW